MAKGWIRLAECGLCGSPRCVVSTSNPRKAYCFRFGKTYFLSNDRQDHRVTGDNVGDSKAKSKENKKQETFDFDDDFDSHMGALEG